MINITVKTLDSQNHQFTVQDEITVAEFKVHIAEKVNIPAETQRIIYCGRVLQDTEKLADYDVEGKVVHLVQRAPPSSANPRPNRAASPTAQQQQDATRNRTGFRGFERANTVFMDSFPSYLMESQGIVPSPPVHSLSGSRLNVAKRMLRRAELAIRALENRNGTADQTPPEEIPEEEVTAVIEARVIVPNSSSSDPIDEAAVINAVQNSLLNASGAPMNLGSSTSVGPQQNSTTTSGSTVGNARASDSVEDTPNNGSRVASDSAAASSSEEQEENGSGANRGLLENSFSITEMADLLTTLGQLQTRFAPFLERYQNFMRDDPEIPEENFVDIRQMQIMINRVSEILHYFAHAYHSLSDFIIRVRNPTPRSLLCRPILIHHSAVVQAGIPIHVEAQLNIHTDHQVPNSNSATNPVQTSTTTNGSNNQNTTAGAQNAASGTPAASVASTIAGLTGLPFMPSGSMRILTAPVEIHAVRGANGNNQGPNNSSATPTAPPAQSDSAGGNNGNSDMEFMMMEVTPDSLPGFRGPLNAPPNEFFQSLTQLVNQFITRVSTPGNEPPPPYAAASSTASATESQSPQAQAANNGQNSQARVNTATNPTTATRTRSTPRPHVHMTQQAMQGGFDPFLPCNSAHIQRRRYFIGDAAPTAPSASIWAPEPPNATRPQQTPNASRSQQTPNASRPQQTPLNQQQGGIGVNVVDGGSGVFQVGGDIDMIRNLVRSLIANIQAPNMPQATTTNSTSQSTPPSGQTTGNSAAATSAAGDFYASLLPSSIPVDQFLSSMARETLQGLPNLLRQTLTVDQIVTQFSPNRSYVPGESLLTDLTMIAIRNMTIMDLFNLNSGNLEALERNRNAVREFILIELCNGDNGPSGIERATNSILNELSGFIQAFSMLPARDDIDIVRSIENVLRVRIPIVIRSMLGTANLRHTLDEALLTLKQLLAVSLRASNNGQQGVEQVFEQAMTRTLQDIPMEFRNFTLTSGRNELRRLMSNLTTPTTDIDSYIVRNNTQEPMADQTEVRPGNLARSDGNLDLTADVDDNNVDEAMDVEETISEPANEEVQAASVNNSPAVIDEPLPNVVVGSEPWHSQVPEDWVPIITRDAQKQRRQSPQGAFSDAYLSGMPSKRRKLLNSAKPHGSLPQVISESVRQAVSATGLTSAAPLDTVAAAAGASPEIQNAYRSLLRTSVQNNLRNNEDFTPERYPNATNYFKE